MYIYIYIYTPPGRSRTRSPSRPAWCTTWRASAWETNDIIDSSIICVIFIMIVIMIIIIIIIIISSSSSKNNSISITSSCVLIVLLSFTCICILIVIVIATFSIKQTKGPNHKDSPKRERTRLHVRSSILRLRRCSLIKELLLGLGSLCIWEFDYQFTIYKFKHNTGFRKEHLNFTPPFVYYLLPLLSSLLLLLVVVVVAELAQGAGSLCLLPSARTCPGGRGRRSPPSWSGGSSPGWWRWDPELYVLYMCMYTYIYIYIYVYIYVHVCSIC